MDQVAPENSEEGIEDEEMDNLEPESDAEMADESELHSESMATDDEDEQEETDRSLNVADQLGEAIDGLFEMLPELHRILDCLRKDRTKIIAEKKAADAVDKEIDEKLEVESKRVEDTVEGQEESTPIASAKVDGVPSTDAEPPEEGSELKRKLTEEIQSDKETESAKTFDTTTVDEVDEPPAKTLRYSSGYQSDMLNDRRSLDSVQNSAYYRDRSISSSGSCRRERSPYRETRPSRRGSETSRDRSELESRYPAPPSGYRVSPPPAPSPSLGYSYDLPPTRTSWSLSSFPPMPYPPSYHPNDPHPSIWRMAQKHRDGHIAMAHVPRL